MEYHKLPNNLQALLPSSDISNLDVQRDKYYIIENLIHNSDIEAWKWMWSIYGAEAITQIIKMSRNLEERDVRIWQNFLNIPENEIICLQPMYQQMRKKYWM